MINIELFEKKTSTPLFNQLNNKKIEGIVNNGSEFYWKLKLWTGFCAKREQKPLFDYISV
jgi:hypothetical protein